MKKTNILVSLFLILISIQAFDIKAAANHNREVANNLLFDAVEKNNFDQAKKAIEVGANVNAKNDEGYTALMIASKHSYTDIVKLLIQHNSTVDEESNEGYTALMLAFSSGDMSLVDLLLKEIHQKKIFDQIENLNLLPRELSQIVTEYSIPNSEDQAKQQETQKNQAVKEAGMFICFTVGICLLKLLSIL